MRVRIEIASAASRPRNDGEKWDSPNQRLIDAFGTVPIFPESGD
jgi:hypothetical protein